MHASQEPTISVVQPWDTNDLDDCLSVCAAGGLHPFPWQELVLRHWLGRLDSGRWSSGVAGLSAPRQNGKTLGIVGARSAYGMLIYGESIIYTSQLQKTSTETFEKLKAFYERKGISKHVDVIKTALGREEIRLKNGGRIKFLARTRNGGNGQHGDLLIFDEAQYLDKRSQQSFLPAISASANPQAIYLGTPPDDDTDAPVFRKIRTAALGGDASRTSWDEWGVQKVTNPYDKESWYKVNPSLGLVLQETTIQDEAESMDDRAFSIDRLGWWRPQAEDVDHPINAERWDSCLVEPDQAAKEGKLAFGVKFSQDGSQCALSAAVVPKEGNPHVELIDIGDTSNGVEESLAPWIAARKKKLALVVIDGKTGQEALKNALISNGIRPKAIKCCAPKDVVAAASVFIDDVKACAITHIESQALDESVKGCASRKIGADGTGFGSTETVSSLPVESASLALWGAKTTKRNPARKQRCY